MTADEAIAIITGAQTMVLNRDPDKFVAAIDRALIALHLERQRDNPKPLPIEELKQMAGDPVWVVCEQCLQGGAAWCILEPCGENFNVLVSRAENRYGRFAGMWNDYGYSWVAYRHKPKGEQKDDKI